MNLLLWKISLVLIIVLMIVLGQNFFNANSIKSISGAKTQPPSLTSVLDFEKPPEKKDSQSNPNILAKTAILIDSQSFERLYEKNPQEKVPIASLTKIMTALVVLEEYPDRLSDVVNITSAMISVDGSDIQLRPGEKITVENLLKGLLIYSGNDAAFSLANFLGGKDEFVKSMNEKAQFLGLKNTHFKDPAGLDDEGFSNAKELAILATYALRNKTFAEIVKTPNIAFASVDGRVVHKLENSNRMLRVEEQFYYPWAMGVKTGFTPAAGHCLVAAAEKDGHQLISVILNTNEDSLTASAKESKKLLEWGFANYQW